MAIYKAFSDKNVEQDAELSVMRSATELKI
jgi:hypothetical protein